MISYERCFEARANTSDEKMKTPAQPSSRENLVRGTLHWSPKCQITGTGPEVARLGARPDARGRNREIRPILILRELEDDSLLVLFVPLLHLTDKTCTSRHGGGFGSVPPADAWAVVPIDPGTTKTRGRPIAHLEEDPEGVFSGASMVFIEIPVVAYRHFFSGWIGALTSASVEVIEHEVFEQQVRRTLNHIHIGYCPVPPANCSIVVAAFLFKGLVDTSRDDINRAIKLLSRKAKPIWNGKGKYWQEQHRQLFVWYLQSLGYETRGIDRIETLPTATRRDSQDSIKDNPDGKECNKVPNSGGPSSGSKGAGKPITPEKSTPSKKAGNYRGRNQPRLNLSAEKGPKVEKGTNASRNSTNFNRNRFSKGNQSQSPVAVLDQPSPTPAGKNEENIPKPTIDDGNPDGNISIWTAGPWKRVVLQDKTEYYRQLQASPVKTKEVDVPSPVASPNTAKGGKNNNRRRWYGNRRRRPGPNGDNRSTQIYGATPGNPS
ncbi:hypothetical protein EDC01DRAFT_635290 [Geopyxis carbonaria]|nr:hypothetical protein EDC01DRAFT_635290 [Geopyxis carbonaria]